ncbi:uncharacterized protein LOC144920271 [Branchiostoma floridae x Branchiostoma belcheri]
MEREKLLLRIRPWKTTNVCFRWFGNLMLYTSTTSMWDFTMFLCVLWDLSAILCSCSWGTCVSVCILGGSAFVSEGPSVISKRQENIGLDPLPIEVLFFLPLSPVSGFTS